MKAYIDNVDSLKLKKSESEEIREKVSKTIKEQLINMTLKEMLSQIYKTPDKILFKELLRAKDKSHEVNPMLPYKSLTLDYEKDYVHGFLKKQV